MSKKSTMGREGVPESRGTWRARGDGRLAAGKASGAGKRLHIRKRECASMFFAISIPSFALLPSLCVHVVCVCTYVSWTGMAGDFVVVGHCFEQSTRKVQAWRREQQEGNESEKKGVRTTACLCVLHTHIALSYMHNVSLLH